MVRIELYDLLSKTQEYIAKYYAAVLTDEHKRDQLKSYIEKFILDGGFLVHGFTEEQLIDRLYSEMVEYSILTPFLGASDLDEININAWDDITLTYSDGSMKKLEEHFRSPQHAIDIVKRLLHHSGMIIDNATPIAQGHLPGNTRITAIKTPVVDEDVGIAVSIRLLHPQRVDRSHIIESGMATEEMIAFLEMCIRYHKWFCKGCMNTQPREEKFYDRILKVLNMVIRHPELLDEVEPADTYESNYEVTSKTNELNCMLNNSQSIDFQKSFAENLFS